jgi:predicted nucleic acid-binding protein
MQAYLVDSSAWIEYFNGNRKCVELIETGILKTPMIVIAELVRYFAKKKFSQQEQATAINFVKSRSLLLQFSAEDAEAAGRLSEKESIPLTDAVIYSYASEETPFLTSDAQHFAGKKNVLLLK